MLYELSHIDVMLLQTACTVANTRMAENAKFAERRANNQHLPKDERASAARMAKWYQKRATDFEAVSKALDEGLEIITLAQAKEALAR